MAESGNVGLATRSILDECRLIVVKIGTAVLTANGMLDASIMQHICDQISELMDSGRKILVVTSGAIGSGRDVLNWQGKKLDLQHQQAAAVMGQSGLTVTYDNCLREHGKRADQLLLTPYDFRNKIHFNNILGTLGVLLEVPNVVVFINANDASATDELKKGRYFGDNDVLSLLTAAGLGAHVLVALSDVPGLLDRQRQRIPIVEEYRGLGKLIFTEKNRGGTGSMVTKIWTGERATSIGIPYAILPGKQLAVLTDFFGKKDVGTFFPPQHFDPADLERMKREWRGAFRVPRGMAGAVPSRDSKIHISLAEARMKRVAL